MKGEIILKGLAASPGVFEGKVKIALSPEEAEEKLKQSKDDAVLVVPMTDPEWTVYIASAGAIVTNSGGILSHAAIVAREFKIPCIVGTRIATEVLQDDMNIRVDGTQGIIYKGSEI